MMISVTQILAKCLCVLYHAVGPSSAFPTLDDLNETEVAPPEPRTKVQIVSEQLVTFFNPVTCRPKTNQAVVPCQAGEKSNKSLCLEHKCCFSSKKHVQLDCYTPLKDRKWHSASRALSLVLQSWTHVVSYAYTATFSQDLVAAFPRGHSRVV
ncbi:Hypothetical predicted protein [Podarcis lilfordi]|uniref:P-type domain-containing protein n=1 Tax=Podarcis lilfordi TaxID=74358 RepID=A0AA35PPK5_9SAUR|nr:Hypothetical predicted protein [Podarcis lilfordi]